MNQNVSASRFRPARDVHHAKILPGPPGFIQTQQRRNRGARWNGIRYQRLLDDYLTGRYGDIFTPGPWIEFIDGPTNERRWCQPDGLLIEIRRGRVSVLEAKYSHTALAYYQLFDLYIPVMLALFPPRLWTFSGIEICARYDPAVPLPARVVLRKNLLDAIPNEMNVHIWSPH